jgi:hypothetical protein
MTRQPFVPGERRYPPLPSNLMAQISQIRTTSNGGLTYRPCSVSLADGSNVDCVFIVEAQAYIRVWGVWPDQDKGKREIKVQDITRVQDSPCRLPAELAQRLYDAGESGMGYVVFEIEYRDGSRSAHASGNALDFVRLADDKTMSDVVAVHPHEGRNRAPSNAPKYFWCIYG